MSFVPIVPPTPPPPSPRARELADLLARVLRDYEDAHPSVTQAEIRQATRLALQSLRAGGSPGAPLVAVAVGVLLLVAGLAVLYLGGDLTVGFGPSSWIAAVVLIGLVLALAAAYRRGP